VQESKAHTQKKLELESGYISPNFQAETTPALSSFSSSSSSSSQLKVHLGDRIWEAILADW